MESIKGEFDAYRKAFLDRLEENVSKRFKEFDGGKNAQTILVPHEIGAFFMENNNFRLLIEAAILLKFGEDEFAHLILAIIASQFIKRTQDTVGGMQ